MLIENIVDVKAKDTARELIVIVDRSVYDAAAIAHSWALGLSVMFKTVDELLTNMSQMMAWVWG